MPAVNLVEIYLLPIIFELATYKPQDKGVRRGENFFEENGYSGKIQGIKETGINFLKLCTELIYVGSMIKKNRTFYQEELSQESHFSNCYR